MEELIFIFIIIFFILFFIGVCFATGYLKAKDEYEHKLERSGCPITLLSFEEAKNLITMSKTDRIKINITSGTYIGLYDIPDSKDDIYFALKTYREYRKFIKWKESYGGYDNSTEKTRMFDVANKDALDQFDELDKKYLT